MNTLTERLQAYMDYKGLNYNQVTVQAGLSIGQIGKAIKSNKGLHSDSIEKIINTYQDLNPEWLLSGCGDMIKNELNRKDKSDSRYLNEMNPLNEHQLNYSLKMQGEFAEEMQGSEQKQGKNPPPDDFLNSINIEAMNKEILIMEKLKRVNNASELYDYVGDFECNLFMCQSYASHYYYGTIYSDIKKFLMRQLSRVELLDRFKDNLDIVRELKEVIIPYKDVLAQLYRDLENFNESHDNLYSLDEIDPKKAKTGAKSTKKPTSN